MTQIPDAAVQAALKEWHDAWNENSNMDDKLSAYAMKEALTAAFPHLTLGFGVKKLEWENSLKGRWVGKPRGNMGNLRFWIFQDNNGFSYANNKGDNTFDTLDKAKSAAQADFERRVRECMVAKTVEVLDDASIQAKVSEIGNQIHNLGCEHQNNEALSDSLKELRDHLWDISKNCTKPVDVAAVRRQAFEEGFENGIEQSLDALNAYDDITRKEAEQDISKLKPDYRALSAEPAQGQWPKERVNIPDPHDSSARIVGFRIRKGDEAWGELGLSEPLFWLDRACRAPTTEANRAALAQGGVE